MMPGFFCEGLGLDGRSEPTFAAGDVGIDEFLIALGEINDAFDQADDSKHAAGHETDDELDHSLLGVSEDEFMGSGPSKKDAEKTSEQFFFGTGWRGSCRFSGHSDISLLSPFRQLKAKVS